MKPILTFIFCYLSSFAFSQDFEGQHPILDEFTALQSNNGVQLKLVISGGESCNGITMYRGIDTTTFVEIGDIAGVCGGSESPVPYEFFDEQPIKNQWVYYRAEMGPLSFTTPLPFRFLNFEDGVSLFPNPTSNTLSLNINISENQEASVYIYNLSGNTIISFTTTEPQTNISVSSLNNGVYYARISYINDVKLIPFIKK
ncbi:MAG: hypothetical protein ACI9RL_001714 [Candidatus Paceibacteria bacterium]|jgi:hypothetical protein